LRLHCTHMTGQSWENKHSGTKNKNRWKATQRNLLPQKRSLVLKLRLKTLCRRSMTDRLGTALFIVETKNVDCGAFTVRLSWVSLTFVCLVPVLRDLRPSRTSFCQVNVSISLNFFKHIVYMCSNVPQELASLR
jgi:hypothetical protein